MTPAQRRFMVLAQQRLTVLQPEMRAALLRTFIIIGAGLSETELARVISAGTFELLVAEIFSEQLLERAFAPVRTRMRSVAERAFQYAIKDLPRSGKIDGVLAVRFDQLNPRVIDAIRSLENAAIETLKGDIKEVARAFVENGLRDGRAPRAIARELRATIGLAPNQEAAVANFRRMLEAADREALTRALRDKRFDGTLKRLFADGRPPTGEQIEKMTAAYRRKFLAFNSNVNARQMTIDSYRMGQRLSWQDAIDKGVIPEGSRLVKTWIHFDQQPDPRPEHIKLNGETVPFDEPYSTGQMVAGEGDYNCKCQDRYSIARIR